jgi:hypothetical protein
LYGTPEFLTKDADCIGDGMENNSPPTLSVTAFTVSSKTNSSEFSSELLLPQEQKNTKPNKSKAKFNLNEKL